MATKKIKRFQEGGVSDKDRGLEASKDDKVSFFERLRMGNIDEEGSEAYRRFGAGRGKAERTPDENRVATSTVKKSAPVASEGVKVNPIPDAPAQFKRDAMEEANARAPIAVPAGPRASSPPSPTRSTPASSALPKIKSDPYQDRPASDNTGASNKFDAAKKRSATRLLDSQKGVSDIANQSSSSAIPGQSVKSPVGEKVEKMSDEKRQLLNMLGATGGGAGLGIVALRKMAQAKKAKDAAKKRAGLKRDTEEGIAQDRASSSKDLAAKQSTTAERSRDLKAGQAKTKFTSESKKPSKRTKKFDDSESNVEFKRGGSVAKASKRADGIATRGKTRCKIC